MNIRSLLLGAAIGLIGVVVSGGRALAGEVLYDESGFLTGQQSFVQSFDVSGPGMLTVSLTNVDWPEQLASLNLVVSSTKGLLGAEMGPGLADFAVTGGSVFVQWFGTAQGLLNTGVYSLDVQFQPSSVMPVSLPTSIGLFLSGLAMLAWQRRNRSDGQSQQQLTA